MPKSTDDATRVRDNQRRSRARRKDLIKDLQARVQEYESQGVAATQEMQRAARKVAQENERLRALLARHGVLNEQINVYLRSFDEADSPEDPKIAAVPNGYASRKLTPIPSAHNYAYWNGGNVSFVYGRVVGQSIQTPYIHSDQVPQMQPSMECMEPVETVPASTPAANNCTQPRTKSCARPLTNSCAKPSSKSCGNAAKNTCTNPEAPTRITLPPILPSQTWSNDTRLHAQQAPIEDPACPNTADCYCPPTDTTSYVQESQAGLGMSCEAAAEIIARMRGDGDKVTAKVALGCGKDEQCMVRNSTVMQLLD